MFWAVNSQIISIVILTAIVAVDLALIVLLIAKRGTIGRTARIAIIVMIAVCTIILLGIIYISWSFGTSNSFA